MKHYLRPSTIWSFAAGLTIGSLGIAAAATFGTSAADQLPACASLHIEYTAVSR